MHNKNKLCGLLLIGGLVALTGCDTVNQKANSTTTDPKTGIVTSTTAQSIIASFGDSKTLVEKVRASAGKTMSVGASGVQEETTTAGLQVIFKTLLDALMQSRSPPSTLQYAPQYVPPYQVPAPPGGYIVPNLGLPPLPGPGP